MNTYTLKVVEIRVETEDTITVCFKQPALKKVKYRSGQYLTLIFRINGRRYIRPYSFSSAPGIDPLLEVTVKRVPNGIVSNHIHDVVQTGDSIEVLPPMGDFVYDRDIPGDELFLWGTGSGITPLISITKQVLAESAGIRVNLIYGNRSHRHTIFSSTIDRLLKEFPDRFKVWHFHTQISVQQTSPYLVQGRITKEKVFGIMKEVDLNSSVHYICGPSGLKESVKLVLSELNVPAEQIFSEDFELVKDPADFEDIKTRQIRLDFNGQEYEMEVIKGKSILECALDAGLELPYSCQTGNCSTCKVKVLTGSLKMIGAANTRRDLLHDEYLACCSYPLTENVHLEVFK